MAIQWADKRIDDGVFITLTDELKIKLFDSLYPIGSIYCSFTNETPNITLSNGNKHASWTAIDNNKFLMSGSSSTLHATGGADTVTLKAENMPKHTHDWGDLKVTGTLQGWSSGTNRQFRAFTTTGLFSTAGDSSGKYLCGHIDSSKTEHCGYLYFDSNGGTKTGNSSYIGSGTAHNNLPPYTTVGMWRRSG